MMIFKRKMLCNVVVKVDPLHLCPTIGHDLGLCGIYLVLEDSTPKLYHSISLKRAGLGLFPDPCGIPKARLNELNNSSTFPYICRRV